MATTLRLGGVDDLLAALARLAPDLAAEAGPLALAFAEQTADSIRAAYPVVTGRLRDSVQVADARGRGPARVFTQISVGAPYAGFVEFGTSSIGPHPVFVPMARRGRAAFVRAVIDQVRDRGLTVTGEA